MVGLLLGQSRFLADVLGPYIKVLNSIPRIILGSIFLVAFGLGTFPKVLLAAVLVFFIVFFNAFQGVREVDPNLVANVRVLGASPLQVARHVTIPSALTWIIASLHTAFGFAIIGALVAEVLGAQRGMGLIISQAQGSFDPDTVFACMAIMAVVTLVAEFLITLLEKRVLSWRPPSHSESAGHLTARRSHPRSVNRTSTQRKEHAMFRRAISLAAIGALALGVTACSSSGGSSSSTRRCPPSSSWSAASTSRSTCPTSSPRTSASTRSTASTCKLSTETNGGVGAEDAMASGQVDMAGAWYIHTIDFQSKGKDVVDVVQLSGAPGEREMCGTNSGVHSAADFKGKTLGVTDLGSGTDELTQFLAAQKGVTHSEYHTLAVGAGTTAIAAIQRNTAQCVMTTQPTVGALERKHLAYSALDLATTQGAQRCARRRVAGGRRARPGRAG